MRKEELIGNGAHWEVYRVYIMTKGIEKSIIHKKPLKNQSPDKNISNYKLIFFNGLPTLSRFSKQLINNKELIEAEDLNPKNCDGFYVSPNTVRNSKNCADIILDYFKKTINILPEEYKECNVLEYSKNLEKISDDREELIEKRILKGAEKYVYENKINSISNFRTFLIQSMKDMKKASDNQIELFSDAFFFRVSDRTKEMDYKIADFDCINSHISSPMNTRELLKGNINYFETSLIEFIEFFIEKDKKNEYLNEIITCGNIG